MLPALLVVVEGPDGSGKTRQTDAVVDALCARGLAASAFHHTRTGASSDALGVLVLALIVFAALGGHS